MDTNKTLSQYHMIGGEDSVKMGQTGPDWWSYYWVERDPVTSREGVDVSSTWYRGGLVTGEVPWSFPPLRVLSFEEVRVVWIEKGGQIRIEQFFSNLSRIRETQNCLQFGVLDFGSGTKRQ